jgi:sugar fermentation stimulation protein A
MLFPPLTQGLFLKRYKRFFVDVKLADGSIVVAHCPNTGSMKTCYEIGGPCLISKAINPERKLKWTLEFTLKGEDFIMVNTGHANTMAREALVSRALAPFNLYEKVEAEQKILDSRFDFKLSQHGLPDCWVEVKNVTLLDSPGIASFPDAVSTRGQKHLYDLIKLKEQGLRAAMLYVVSRSDATAFKCAEHIDPDYAQALKEAAKKGVEIYAFAVDKIEDQYKLQRPIEVLL